MAKESLIKGKNNLDLNDQLSKIEMYMNDLVRLHSVLPRLADPQVILMAPGEVGLENETQTSVASNPTEPYRHFPFTYLKCNPLIPHINYSGTAPHYDGTHFSFLENFYEVSSL
jgi:hypothetical protein